MSKAEDLLGKITDHDNVDEFLDLKGIFKKAEPELRELLNIADDIQELSTELKLAQDNVDELTVALEHAKRVSSQATNKLDRAEPNTSKIRMWSKEYLDPFVEGFGFTRVASPDRSASAYENEKNNSLIISFKIRPVENHPGRLFMTAEVNRKTLIDQLVDKKLTLYKLGKKLKKYAPKGK